MEDKKEVANPSTKTQPASNHDQKYKSLVIDSSAIHKLLKQQKSNS